MELSESKIYDKMNHHLLKNKDIVVIGLQPWDIEIGSNCKNIAQEFAKYNRVLYVNRALDRYSAIKFKEDKKIINRKKVHKGEVDDINQISKNLWVLNPRTVLESINWIPINWLFNLGNRVNNRRFAKKINSAIDTLEFNNIILFIDNDFYRTYYLKEYIAPSKFIYYIRDNLTGQKYFKKHGTRLEPKLIKKADVVVANSAYLSDYAKKYNPNSFNVGQGCDFTNFENTTSLFIPDSLKSIKKPIIGFVGALLGIRLDIDIIEYIAINKPNWNIVLVGPQDKIFENSKLHSFPNIYFLGSKPSNDLARYIKYFDVCINPQLVNYMTIGNYPRKIDEYLALGKPVVATKTKAMKLFEDFIYLCENKNEYIEKIDMALNEKDFFLIRKRKSFAFSHTWENNVNKIKEIIANLK